MFLSIGRCHIHHVSFVVHRLCCNTACFWNRVKDILLAPLGSEPEQVHDQGYMTWRRKEFA